MHIRPRPILAILALSLALSFASLSACGEKADAGPSPADLEAQAAFKTLCVTCHGDKGLGDGPGAAALEPKPRSFSDQAWQASVTDEDIRKVIALGGAAVGKSAAMPAQPQLKSKPQVLDALVRYVRKFGK